MLTINCNVPHECGLDKTKTFDNKHFLLYFYWSEGFPQPDIGFLLDKSEGWVKDHQGLVFDFLIAEMKLRNGNDYRAMISHGWRKKIITEEHDHLVDAAHKKLKGRKK